jgi:hypothetical protein
MSLFTGKNDTDAGAFIGSLAEYEDQKTIRNLESRIKILEDSLANEKGVSHNTRMVLDTMHEKHEAAKSRIKILEADLLKRDKDIEDAKYIIGRISSFLEDACRDAGYKRNPFTRQPVC